MTDAYQALDSLRTMLTKQREEVKERMANGHEHDKDYSVSVGRAKALKDVIAKITDQIRSLGGQDDDAKQQ